jgi:hypothetical protein
MIVSFRVMGRLVELIEAGRRGAAHIHPDGPRPPSCSRQRRYCGDSMREYVDDEHAASASQQSR